MAKGKEEQDKLSVLFSQRFKDQEAAPVEEGAAEKPPRKRGRPRKAVQRKTMSFFLTPELAERLDDAYYDWNAALPKSIRKSRAEFREMVLEKGLEQIAKRRVRFRSVGD